MKAEKFELLVSYYQFGIFDAAVKNPFNDWFPEHVAQGFAWRPDSAFFQTPFGDGAHVFEVWVANHRPPLDGKAVRAIIVPFPKRTTAALEVGSVGASHVLRMPADRDSIFVEFAVYEDSEIPLVRITFYNEGETVFQIVKADSAEMANAKLVVTAQPGNFGDSAL
ncbi:MAG: hypothetical protein E6G89_13305, partial [Alphaproteobacteria bacterium]